MKISQLSINAISLILILNCFGCNGQINKKETTSKMSEVEEITKNISSKDSLKYNQYQNEKKQGIWREYYENGKLKSESNFVKGKKEGLCKEWWKTGNLWTEGMYKNDKANGLMKWHNQEGILVAEGNMTDNKRDGRWKICDFQIISNCIEANFKNEKKVGIWKILHDNGELSKEQNWNDGKMISEKCWDESGNKIECNSNSN